VHLDGSLRLKSLVELARDRKVALPSETPEGLEALGFRPRYASLAEYLEGFRYTVGVLQDAEALERAAYELAEDCQADGVRYVEVRFAPQLHVRPGFEVPDVVRAVDRGLRRAAAAFNARPEVAQGQEPPFAAGILLCAMRFFRPEFSLGFRRFFETLPEASEREIHAAASLEVARAAARLKNEEGLLVVGIDLAGQEKGYPAEDQPGTRSRTRRSWARRSTRARTTGRSRSSRRSATCTPIGSATGRGCSTSRRSRHGGSPTGPPTLSGWRSSSPTSESPSRSA
jgi:adenosine deaminase